MNKNLPILYSEIQAANKRIEKIKLVALFFSKYRTLAYQKELLLKYILFSDRKHLYIHIPVKAGRSIFYQMYLEMLKLKGDKK